METESKPIETLQALLKASQQIEKYITDSPESPVENNERYRVLMQSWAKMEMTVTISSQRKGGGPYAPRPPAPISEGQIRYVKDLASQKRIVVLTPILTKDFGGKKLEELTMQQAGALIDWLKAQK